MKQAFLKAPFQVEIREVPVPPLGDDEVLVQVKACGVREVPAAVVKKTRRQRGRAHVNGNAKAAKGGAGAKADGSAARKDICASRGRQLLHLTVALHYGKAGKAHTSLKLSLTKMLKLRFCGFR